MSDIAHEFVFGLLNVLSWSTLSMMLVGILAGVVVGLLPGLGGPATLALMLPFIYKMEPVQAFAFLLGMASICGTSGDITSILFGVPGEATTAATIVDGHPMAKKGEAGRALGAVLMSSMVGAAFGAFALALAVPIVRPLVLAFGSPEFFMLAILGISLIASLSSDTIVKGIISGGIGLMLASVGMNPISGIQRFTFDQVFLWDGIGLVAVTVGIFAIPETIDLAIQGSSIAETHPGKIGGVLEGIKDTFRHLGLVLRCSAIGTYTGIVPGMGGTVGQWIAYAHAVQSSSDKDRVRFGKGAVEGVLGPGAANNSSFGGGLIPTIAFGIPGNIPSAILLGAFIIQGLVPGPDMLLPSQKGGHLDLTFSLVWIIVLSNLISVGGFFIFLKQMAKITQLRSGLIIPFILCLVYLGAFAEKNAFPDLLIVLIFGLFGWAMMRFEWPRPPLILGLVLGPLAEQKLFLSTDRYGYAWLHRPGVIIIFLLIFATIFYPIIKAQFKKRGAAKKESGPTDDQSGRVSSSGPMINLQGKTVFSFFVLAVFTAATINSLNWNIRAGLFPWVVGFSVCPLLVYQFLKDIWGRGETQKITAPNHAEPVLSSTVLARRTIRIVSWTVGFFVAIWLLGFIIALPLMTFLYLKFEARESWLLSIILSFSLWGFLYGLFVRTLHLPFPDGIIF